MSGFQGLLKSPKHVRIVIPESGRTKSLLTEGGKGVRSKTTHGLSKTRLYNTWIHILHRCLNKNDAAYSDYGGRGITVCSNWLDLTEFYSWAMSHGYSDDLEIDRIDNDKGYFPENCRFVTHQVNCNNRRRRTDNKVGYTGVYPRSSGRYRVLIGETGTKKLIHLGHFDTVKEAVDARNKYILSNNLSNKTQEYHGT